MCNTWCPPSPATENNSADHILLARIAQRDVHALAWLYDRYSPLIYALALRVLGNQTAAEAIVIDVFADIWQAPADISVDGSIRAALLARTWQHIQEMRPHHDARSLRLRSLFDNELFDNDRNRMRGAPASTEHDPQMRKLTIRTLPPEQRAILELSYYDRLTIAEIATRLALPLATVKMHLRQGLLTLHQSVFPAE